MSNPQQNNEPEDPVDSMLNKTGCAELHYKVQVCRLLYATNTDQISMFKIHDEMTFITSFYCFYPKECIAETQDWRKCKDIVTEFRQCMAAYTTEQQRKYNTPKKS